MKRGEIMQDRAGLTRHDEGGGRAAEGEDGGDLHGVGPDRFHQRAHEHMSGGGGSEGHKSHRPRRGEPPSSADLSIIPPFP